MNQLPFYSSLAALCLLFSNAHGADLSADDLASRLNEGMQGNARIRARLEIAGSDTDTPVLQLQIKERRTSAGADVAYEVLWPKERQGETIFLRQRGNSAPEGSVAKPSGDLKKLSSSDMDTPLLGSALAYQDLIENFYAWPSQSLVGMEKVDGRETQILESKPSGSETIYGKVRSWIDTDRMVPLKVEKFSKSGASVRRIITTRVSRDDNGRIIPANLDVQRAGSSSGTRLTGSRIDQDVKFSDSDFNPSH